MLDEGSEGSGKEGKSHDIMLLTHLLPCKYAILLLQGFDGSPAQHISEHIMLTKRFVAEM